MQDPVKITFQLTLSTYKARILQVDDAGNNANFTTTFMFYIGTSAQTNNHVNGGILTKSDGTQLNVSTYQVMTMQQDLSDALTQAHGSSMGDTFPS